MFRFLFAISALVLFGPSALAGTDGPFGIEIGSPVSKYSCTNADNTFFECAAPKSHPSFDKYIVQATPKQGVCWIKGMGKDISTNGYGFSLKAKAREIADQVGSVYGDFDESVDHLVYGSIWDDVDEWMMSLLVDDRMFYYRWSDISVRRVQEIYVSVNALSSSKGYVSVEFYGDNYELCKSEQSEAEADAF